MSILEASLIGHRVRIISKAQIRYEGVLYTLRKDDNNELVLVLSKVISYGTEDRPCEHPVKPMSEVYEHIAFRGRELVDLQLLPNPEVGNDPSIISAELEPPSSSLPASGASGDVPTISGLFSQQQHAPNFPGVPNLFSSIHQQSNVQSDLPPSWSNMSGLTNADNEGSTSNNPPQPAGAPAGDSNAQPKSQEVYRSPSNGTQDNEEKTGNNNQQQQDRNRGGGSGYRSNYSSYQRNNRGGSHPRRNYNQRRNYDHGFRISHDDIDYKQEYDFEKPNAELAEFLEKVDLKSNSNATSEHGEDSGHQDEEAYNSSKSFFDTLSSELMDRANGVPKNRSNRDDRRVNIITFGPSATRMSYRGANYRGGRRGNSNYRGNQRGGFTYSSGNRQHSNYQNRRDGGAKAKSENVSGASQPQSQQK
ncbi:unnamed protein product [Hymenolepis diminuta]|uniref:FFD box profile domain-containing protein n=1 Tax=Hymenolepis diminuta TaxID=6216 RepID=A0A564YRH3_HYMDI|nr:unnamed protein product [Hymenolepis diminuta]